MSSQQDENSAIVDFLESQSKTPEIRTVWDNFNTLPSHQLLLDGALEA